MFAMPPEWAPHEATWLSWPHNQKTWPDGVEGAEAAFVQAVAALVPGETVHINTEDPARVRKLLEGRVPMQQVVLEGIPTDDAWIRDYGAIVVRDEACKRVALDFRFNSWGGKYPPFDRDDAVARRMAERLGLPCVTLDMVLEGGSIDVNGAGTLLTTEQCLLNPNRNPDLSREEIEAHLARYLGARRVVWLGEGVAGDDTDGHVDDIARFVSEDTVVAVVEPNTADANHAPLAENVRRLRAAHLRVIELPLPPPLHRGDERLPASYANFYIANGVVIVPTFNDPNDRVALNTLADLLPGRQVVGIHAVDLVWGLGTLHCLTQQQPAARGRRGTSKG